MKKKKILKFLILGLASIAFIAFMLWGLRESSLILVSGVPKEESADRNVEIGIVNVKYVDLDGNKIADDDIIQGPIGEEYVSTRKEITGYKATGKEPFNKTGTYTNTSKTVTYIYKETTENTSVTANNNNVTIQIQSRREPTEYKLEIVSEINGEKISGSGLTVEKDDTKLITESTINGLLRAGTITVNDTGTDTYKIYELSPSIKSGEKDEEKLIEKVYIYKAIEENVELKFEKVWNDTENKYEIVLIDADKYPNAKIELLENNVIRVTLEYEEIEEERKIEKFDLSLDKYIEKVDITDETGTQTITRTDSDTDLLKIEIPRQKINSSEVEITYVLKVTNVGNEEGYAKEITDIIPDGLKFIGDENIWSINGNVATTKVLSNQLIKPGESKEVRIDFKWILAEGAGTKTNFGSITESYNEKGLQDTTKDNSDEEDMIVSIKTGGDIIYISSTLGFIAIAIVVINFEKIFKMKRKENE